MEAAAELGVLVFGSAPLAEGDLLQGRPGLLDAVFSLGDQPSAAAKLLQFSRSVPGAAGVLVGHKAREHVEPNVALSRAPRLGDDVFWLVKAQVAAALRRAAVAAVAGAEGEEGAT